MKARDVLLFDDGLVRMDVLSTDPARNLLQAQVSFGKVLGENKGVNMPGSRLSGLGITEKDWEDILFAIEQDIDFLALSFVRSSREVKSLKSYLEQKKKNIHVIAKIEKDEAIDAIDDILFYSDGIMVARGDLGVEIGNEKVALVQKKLIKKARDAGKPVITATQMLMSMVSAPTPSRAEASDVANAVLDGSDALMLSNETATGQYPMESVQTMASIILGAETLDAPPPPSLTEVPGPLPITEAIDLAAANLADNLHAKGIAALTRSGLSARLLAKHRPHVPIYAFAENTKVRSQLCLSWGVNVVPWKEIDAKDHTAFEDMMDELARLSLLHEGDLVVMTAGIPTSLKAGTTNTVVVRSYSRKRSS
jgi:pyruvate kinase